MNHCKILVTASTFPRWENDSVPRFVLDICKSLTIQGDIECLVLAPHTQGAARRETLEGIAVQRYRYMFPSSLELISGQGIIAKIRKDKKLGCLVPLFLFFQLVATLKIIWRFHPDVLLSNWLIPQGLIAALVKLVCPRLKIVLICQGGDLGFIEAHPFSRRLAQFILSKMDGVVATCHLFQQKLLALEPSRTREIPVIPMGIDVNRFLHCRNQRVNTPRARKDILFIGRLEEKKGVTYLLKALSEVQQHIVEIQLKIIGDGTLREQLLELVAQLHLTQNVSFLGGIAHAQLADFLADACMLVVPSIDADDDYEGIPRTLLEAAAGNVPIVTTNAGGIPDFIEHRKTGLIAKQRDPHDLAMQMIALLEQEHLQGMLTENAYHTLRHNFSLEILGKRLRDEILRHAF